MALSALIVPMSANCADTDTVLASATHLVRAAAAEGDGFPDVHAGISRGMAIPHSALRRLVRPTRQPR